MIRDLPHVQMPHRFPQRIQFRCPKNLLLPSAALQMLTLLANGQNRWSSRFFVGPMVGVKQASRKSARSRTGESVQGQGISSILSYLASLCLSEIGAYHVGANRQIGKAWH
jgi:hypothetical protein